MWKATDPISQLDLSTEATRVLRVLEIKTIGQLLTLLPEDGGRVPGYGSVAVRAIRRIQNRVRAEMRWSVVPWRNTEQHALHSESFQDMVTSLPVRARQALVLLNVTTLDQFIGLDPERVLSVQGVGTTTVCAIAGMQQCLRTRLAAPPKVATAASWRTPFREESAAWRDSRARAWPPWSTPFLEESATQLPLFIGDCAEPAQLHESYFGDAKVSALGLPGQASHAMEDCGIRTVGQLVCTPFHLLLGGRTFGSAALKAIQDAVLAFLRQRNGLVVGEEPLVGSSFEQFSNAVLTRFIISERSREVLRRRIGLDSGQSATLEHIAQAFSVTRERIRQIEKNAIQALRVDRCRQLLAQFLSAAGSYFDECGGIASHEEVAVSMAERFQWPQVQAPKTLSSLLAACDDAYAVNVCVIQREHRCRKCFRARAAIEQMALRQERVSFGEARDALRVSCASHCSGHESAAILASNAFLSELVEAGDDGTARLYVIDGAISTSSGREPSLDRKCAAVVMAAKHPVHYLDVWKAVTTKGGMRLPQLRVHCYLNRNRDLLLWDRGTFVHPNYVNYDTAVVHRLAQTIALKLENGIPFLSVYGIYQEFMEHATAAGLPSDHALYSVLRRDAVSLLACDRYPYVRLANSRTHHLSAAQFVEHLVQEADGPIRVDEVRRKLCDELGVRNSHCNQAIAQAGGVCSTGNGYLIHIDHIDIRPDAIEPVIQHTLALLSRCEHISVARIFDDRRATCVSLGIHTPRLLYEVLDRLASGRLAARGYPQLRLPDDDCDNSVREDIAEYVREKKRPVSIEDIGELFATSRGYRPITVYQASTSRPLHPYYPGCVVHADTLGLQREHSRQLVEEALRFYDSTTSGTECWATIDTFLEICEDSLPRLDNGASWTGLLAHSLLSTETDVRFVGNAHAAYVRVPNPYGVESLDDLCAIVVAEVFGGGCSIKQLTDHLVGGQVIRKQLTPAMLTTDRIVIDGGQVCLKELVAPCFPR